MSDRPVRTRVLADGRWWPLQEFMISDRGEGAVLRRRLPRRGGPAPPTPEVLDAIASARAIVIGPSNPVISIGPILALAGLREAIRPAPRRSWRSARWSRGRVVKGPTAAFMRWAGHPLTSDGIAADYDGLLDGLVADEPPGSLPVLETDVLMDSGRARRRLAEQTLEFALGLA